MKGDEVPAKSGKQYRLFQVAAHGNLRGTGPSPEVANEMIHKTPADKRSQFMKGFGKKGKKRG